MGTVIMVTLLLLLLSLLFGGSSSAVINYLIDITEEIEPRALSIPISLDGGVPYESSVYLSLANSVCWVTSAYCYTENCYNMSPANFYSSNGVSSRQYPYQVYISSAFGSQITGASVTNYCLLSTNPPGYPEFILNLISAVRVVNYGNNRLPGVFGFGPGTPPNRRISPLVNVLSSTIFSIVFSDEARYLILGEPEGWPGSDYRGTSILMNVPLYKLDDTWNYQITDFGTNTGSTVYTGLTGIAVLSTDSFPIEIPKAAGTAMAAALGATVIPGAVDAYTILCSSVPTMGSIIFQTVVGTVSLSGFQIVDSGLGMCTFKIVGKDAARHGEPLWTMGVDFLASFFTTFNPDQSDISFSEPATSG